jgi:Cornichon protein
MKHGFQWVIPKITAQAIFNFFLLMHGCWILTLVNLPMTAWLIYEYVNNYDYEMLHYSIKNNLSSQL